ncbi:MAG: hypothetical protein HC793_00150 [Aquincola sp.]|nr:hypothetical protein [Aquincola sp.]
MAQIKEVVIRFRQSESPDVVANRFRIRPAGTTAAYDTPFDELPATAADADGFTRVPAVNVPALAGLEGQYDVHISAVDSVGNESDFLEIDNQTFDLSPPEAPTDGSIE